MSDETNFFTAVVGAFVLAIVFTVSLVDLANDDHQRSADVKITQVKACANAENVDSCLSSIR